MIPGLLHILTLIIFTKRFLTLMYFVFFVISRRVAGYVGILGFWNSFLC